MMFSAIYPPDAAEYISREDVLTFVVETSDISSLNVMVDGKEAIISGAFTQHAGGTASHITDNGDGTFDVSVDMSDNFGDYTRVHWSLRAVDCTDVDLTFRTTDTSPPYIVDYEPKLQVSPFGEVVILFADDGRGVAHLSVSINNQLAFNETSGFQPGYSGSLLPGKLTIKFLMSPDTQYHVTVDADDL